MKPRTVVHAADADVARMSRKYGIHRCIPDFHAIQITAENAIRKIKREGKMIGLPRVDRCGNVRRTPRARITACYINIPVKNIHREGIRCSAFFIQNLTACCAACTEDKLYGP